MQTVRTFVAAALSCLVMTAAEAQTVDSTEVEKPRTTEVEKPKSTEVDKPKKENLVKRFDNKLSTRYYKSKYDTNYVVRPAERWLLKPSLNFSGTSVHAKGTVRDFWSKHDLRTHLNTYISLEVDYCDIAVSLSLNPDKLKGTYDDYEFNFEYHGNMFSLDLDYQRATSLSGDIEFGKIHHLDENALHMKNFTLTAYYIFNHRRFSFPAAFCQNYYQLRSAGSWLAGLTFQSGCIKTTNELKERNPQAPEIHIDAAHVGIGGGYAYNLVLGHRAQWLLHLSLMPTFVVYNHNRMMVNGEENKVNHMRLNMVFNERAAVVYRFSPRCFAGANLIMSNSIFDDKAVVINQNKWLVHSFVGIRL